MANSTITLYKKSANWKLLPQNLFMLDDISAYLSAVSSSDKIVLTDMQYIKNQLEIEIRVDMSQTNANPITNFAYVEVANYGEGRSYYYFIKQVEWRAYSTCRFVLVMDVLNSIKYGTDYTLSPKTKINRQHKNRLVKKTFNNSITTFIKFDAGYPVDIQDYVGTTIQIVIDDISATPFSVELIAEEYTGANNIYELTLSYSAHLYGALVDFEELSSVTLTGFNSVLFGSGDIKSGTIVNATINYYRKIDYLSENIPCVTYHDLPSDELINNTDNNSDWYLIYATDNAPTTTELNNPLRCYLCTNANIIVRPNQPIVQGRIYPEMLETGKFYYYQTDSDSRKITLASGEEVSLPLNGLDNNSQLTIYKNGNSIIVNRRRFNVGLTEWRVNTYNATPYIILQVDMLFKVTASPELDYAYPSGTYPTITFLLADYPEVTLDTIEGLDRTDSKIVKIIKLPYSPYNFSYSGSILIIPPEWEFGVFQGKSFLKLKDLNTKFNYEFNSSVDNLNALFLLTSAPDYTQSRSDYWESKIYHSDYYVPKVVYDSFAFGFNMEKVDLNYVHAHRTDTQLAITFTCTTTINSRFMLQFPQYSCGKLGTQDYNDVMPIARNNEIALYNVPYINYIRTGYNYDVKSKNRQNAMNFLSLGLGLAGTIGSLFLPTTALTLPIVIGLGASTIKSLVSTISSASQSEQNIQQKLQEAQAQGASVSGSDDVDLMSEYTGNRASLMTYKASDTMHELLLDLFYYTGYTDNVMGVPNLNTRKWFNFVACEAIIDMVNGQLVNISEEIQAELINLWKAGVTILHKVNGVYDMDQVKENAEVTIAEL